MHVVRGGEPLSGAPSDLWSERLSTIWGASVRLATSGLTESRMPDQRGSSDEAHPCDCPWRLPRTLIRNASRNDR